VHAAPTPDFVRAEAGESTVSTKGVEWQAFVDDIRTCLWGDAHDVAAPVRDPRLIGMLCAGPRDLLIENTHRDGDGCAGE